ncbi:hypothetical protein CMK18_17055 [Candidatus Poribacteria bacterium]|mgnify:FL=1|nr:hypothetical protein [Candidatus Poribacteria bacterium]|tara:strand:- start:548 stop:1423 length:876 start_codon:yes stop_codon:yes gene_type:complete
MKTVISFFVFTICIALIQSAEPTKLKLHWSKNMLTISGDHLPGKEMKIHYLEAYCRANSHDADWSNHTVIGHKTELVSLNKEKTELKLYCKVSDGITVKHLISTTHDEIDFNLTAYNPTNKESEAHWAQPCIRVGKFTGTSANTTKDKYAYIKKSFVYLDGKRTMMPTQGWATEARYIPGQVWTGPGVSRADVNPRPLHKATPSNGLIGCYSADNTMIFATAFEPYQELFQGVIRCLHSDFRLGGLKPKEKLNIRGKIYIVKNDEKELLIRYQKDFPKHNQLHRNKQETEF